jgi:hypothetical protein
MGPDRRHPVKARALRAPINPSISKGCTEVEPSCSASVSSSRRDRRRNRTARLLQRRRLQQHCTVLGLEPVDHVAARQGMGRIRSARAHTRPGRSFRLHSEDTRCATGVRGRGRPRFPVSEISRHSNCEPACAVRCTGQTPPVGIVQHLGSAKPRRHARRRWFERWRLSDVGRRLRLPDHINGEPCPQFESEIQATLVGGIGGLHNARADIVTVTRIITRLSPWSRTGTIPLRRAFSCWFPQSAKLLRSEDRAV